MEISFLPGLKKAFMPLIVSSGELKNWSFLIDTSSTHNIIFSYVYEHFKEQFKVLEDATDIMGIEGNKKEVSAVEGTFQFGDTEYTSQFCIFDATDAMTQVYEESGIQICGILGITFLIENHLKIDFEKYVLTDN